MTPQPLCFHCRKPLGFSVGATVQFRDSCASCHCDAHVCRNCQFFDESAHHECRESSAEWVRDKERGNRCEYFRLATGSEASSTAKAATMAALDDLFKK